MNKYFVNINKELKFKDNHIVMICLSLRRKKPFIIKVRCMRCGNARIISYKNYKTVFDKKRIINDKQEITHIYTCNNCVKILALSNSITRRKLSLVGKRRTKESRIKANLWRSDPIRVKIAYEKQMATRLKNNNGKLVSQETLRKSQKTRRKNFLRQLNNLKVSYSDNFLILYFFIFR